MENRELTLGVGWEAVGSGQAGKKMGRAGQGREAGTGTGKNRAGRQAGTGRATTCS